MELPLSFREEMKEFLGEEADLFFETCEKNAFAGLRWNTLRKNPALLKNHQEKEENRVPWTEEGYYLNPDETPGKDPLYYAGAYYIQEPSAMAPAEFLPVEPGMTVLDLCAAPGGKSTRLGEKLNGKGTLLANDISASRAQALLRNLERFGVGNIFVTAESPEKLALAYPESFDRILVDAPCSGEGMFRKDPSLIHSFEERGPEDYAPLQKEILEQAVRMLKPDGILLYSTCTFSPREDEEVMEEILQIHPEMEELSLESHPLYRPEMMKCRRGIKFFPHRLKGEGHFLAMLHKICVENNQNSDAANLSHELLPERKEKKESLAAERTTRYKKGFGTVSTIPAKGKGHSETNQSPDVRLQPETQEFLQHCLVTWEADRLYVKDGRCYYLPENLPLCPGIRYLRTGLYLGEQKKNRFEPSQALAMWLNPERFDCTISFAAGSTEAVHYLKGETISSGSDFPSAGENSWCLICLDGYPLGFAKRAGNNWKNRLDAGWRML